MKKNKVTTKMEEVETMISTIRELKEIKNRISKYAKKLNHGNPTEIHFGFSNNKSDGCGDHDCDACSSDILRNMLKLELGQKTMFRIIQVINEELNIEILELEESLEAIGIK